MAQGYFVTGTDTGIGKTWSSLALMQYFQEKGGRVVGMKPVASGCEILDGQLRNDDALQLQAQSSIDIEYEAVNPYAFAMPVSPHLAAKKVAEEIDISVIKEKYDYLASLADVVIVEGVGGWMVPLNDKQDVSCLAENLGLPVIVVVGMRLGCINQAKLTFLAIRQSGLPCLGWIASCVEEGMLELADNIATIKEVADMPLLATLPYKKQRDVEDYNKISIKTLQQ